MPETKPRKLEGFMVNAQTDIPDIRDWPYEPALIQLRPKIDPPSGLSILNQRSEGACTGFGLGGHQPPQPATEQYDPGFPPDALRDGEEIRRMGGGGLLRLQLSRRHQGLVQHGGLQR